MAPISFSVPSSERNKLCPCGSGKKYKYCFGLGDPNCSLYAKAHRQKILKEHHSRETEVFDFFRRVMEESAQVFLSDEKGVDRMPLRIQMLVAFSVIDVLANYWFEYVGRTGKPSERAMVWYEKFCAVEENKQHTGLLREVSGARLYIFRNGLVHFFGMGENSDEDISISLAGNDLSEESKFEWEKKFLELGKKNLLMRPRDFFNLVREGALLMIAYWQGVIAEAQLNPIKEKEYIEGIERVYSKIMKEGAIGIAKDHEDLKWLHK